MTESGTGTELEKVIGERRVATIKGETFEIKPFTIGQLGQVMKYVGELTQFADVNGDIKILEAFEHGSDAILSIAALSIKKDRAWFDEVEVDEGLQLVLAIYEVNMDFFAQRVEPIFRKALSQLNRLPKI